MIQPFGRPFQPEARPWTTSASIYGSFASSGAPAARRRPTAAPVSNVKITSEMVGSFYANFKPLVRPRPPSDATIQMRNRAVREGVASSEIVGDHTGVAPKRSFPVLESQSVVQRLATDTETQNIGRHTPPPPLNMSNLASLHMEANYARRFPRHHNVARDAAAAIRFQDTFASRAAKLEPPKLGEHSINTASHFAMSNRADGSTMVTQSFDGIYSNSFVGRKSQSAMATGGCKSTVDPRCWFSRPKSMAYGSPFSGQPEHRIQTPVGARRVLPSRSFMPIGAGSPGENKSRALDF